MRSNVTWMIRLNGAVSSSSSVLCEEISAHYVSSILECAGRTESSSSGLFIYSRVLLSSNLGNVMKNNTCNNNVKWCEVTLSLRRHWKQALGCHSVDRRQSTEEQTQDTEQPNPNLHFKAGCSGRIICLEQAKVPNTRGKAQSKNTGYKVLKSDQIHPPSAKLKIFACKCFVDTGKKQSDGYCAAKASWSSSSSQKNIFCNGNDNKKGTRSQAGLEHLGIFSQFAARHNVEKGHSLNSWRKQIFGPDNLFCLGVYQSNLHPLL